MYVVPKPPKGGLKNRLSIGTDVDNRKVSEIWTINCDNSERVRDRMSVTINH